jgi:hypothetical protein
MKLSGSSSRSFIGARFTRGMLIPPGRGRSAALLLPVGLAFGLIATACGGGSSTPATTTTPPTTAAAAASPSGGGAGGDTGFNSQLTAFRSCMASHGEPLPTRPPRSSTTQGTGTTVAPDNGTGGPGGPGGGGGFGGGGFFLGGGGNGTGFLLRGLNQNDPKVMAAYNACKGQIPASLIQAQQQRSQQLNAFISCMADHGVTISTGPPAADTTRTTIDQSSAAYQTCKVLLPNGGAFGPRGSTTTTAP